MTLNQQWGGGGSGGLNPPEPLPMGGSSSSAGVKRDPGFIGGGLPSAGSGGGGVSAIGGGRQITKNPMNMLGGLGGSNSNGVYTNGSSSSSSSFDQQGLRGMGGGGAGFPGDRMNGASVDRMRAPGAPSGGSGSMNGMGGMMGAGKMGGGGYGGGMDSYGMGGMARQQQRSPPSSRFNGFGGGSIGDRGGASITNGNLSGLGDRNPMSAFDSRDDYRNMLGGSNSQQRDMMMGGGNQRDMMNPRDIMGGLGGQRDMMGGGGGSNQRDMMMRDMMGGGGGHRSDMVDSRGGGGGGGNMFRDLVDPRGDGMMGGGGGGGMMGRGGNGGGPDPRMLREYQLQQEMREREMYRSMRDNNGSTNHHLVRSNSEMGPERNLAMLDRTLNMSRSGGSGQMPRDMMSGGGRDFMRSNSEMMGHHNNYHRDRMDMMGGNSGGGGMRDMMGGNGGGMRDMMGGNNRMDMSSYHHNSQRDNMMGGGPQRSMSMNNGGYGMGSSGGGGMDNGYNRSMSFNGPPSPPGGSDMKIGTWNDVGVSNNGGNAANSGVGSVSNFEIGTFNINDPTSGSSRNNFGGSSGGMGTFNAGSTSGSGNGTTQSNNGPFQPGMGIRETGIIEKLLHSYGFIQCCDRQARLFFHFSQFEGNIEHLKIGDPVEFEMTYDRRTGKPIASAVSKIAPEVVMSEERVIGTVTTEVKVASVEGGNETQGRISYENRGECFFLPFNTTDVEGNVTLTAGDKVSFQMATVQRSGNLAAKTIRLENPAAPVKYRGVVNSLQDTFGFIERADVVKEIYFNIIDMQQDGVKEDNSGIQLGDDVEFIIQTRSGKEVASNLTKLPPGTVVFEDIGTEWFRGQVLKPLDRSGKYQQTEALPGKVKYRAADRSEAEIPFGEKDQLGDFTLKHGDWVKFIVATDRRDKLKRATKIELLDESFSVSDERREQGVVQQLKAEGGAGFIKCVDRSDKMAFYFSECLDVSRKLTVGDEVEFTTAPDPKMLQQFLATRIKHLVPGTVKFDIIIAQNILGVVAEEPCPSAWAAVSPSKSPSGNGEASPMKEGAGRIVYELNSVQLSIPVYAADCDARNPPRLGDKVQFNINQLKATKETNAMNVRVLERANIELPSNSAGSAETSPASTPTPPAAISASTSPSSAAIAVAAAASATAASDSDALSTSPPPKEKKESRLGSPQRGYVAALKDGFGFIETLQHDKEIFFHFSHVEGKADKLEVGLEVEYYVYSREKGGKVSAEGVKVLPKGSIPKPMVKEEMLYGKVVRPLRSVNPDQADYCGLIVSKSEEGKVLGEYQFGIASLLNKKELLQEGDPVNFQVSVNEPFAYNIKSNKQKLRANVEAVKGQFGFLAFEQEEGKKLFFHMSEVEGGEVLQVGDQVEFVVVTNSRTKKHSACCVRKLGASQRPERLISKLKTLSLEEGTRGGPKLIVIRQPRGPDGTRGFAAVRGKIEETAPIDLMEQLTAQ